MPTAPSVDEKRNLFDTHSHLDDPAFDADRDEVIERARDAGVRSIVVVGYHAGIWERSVRTAGAFPGGLVALGVHPQHADDFDDTTVQRLRLAIHSSGAAAIGETGIDLFRDGPPLPAQQRAFAAQLDLALELGLPTIIHQRAAEEAVLDVLRGSAPHQPIVLHSFDAGEETARLAHKRGWYIGVGGLMTRAASDSIREILRDFPLDRLVLETDSPYLVPTGIRARRNEPGHLVAIAERLANLRGISTDEVARATTENARRLFGARHAPNSTAAVTAVTSGDEG